VTDYHQTVFSEG